MQIALTLRKHVVSRRARAQRKKTLALSLILVLGIAGALTFLLVGCGGSVTNPPIIPSPPPILGAADAQNMVQAAAEAAKPATMVIAVVDRAGV